MKIKTRKKSTTFVYDKLPLILWNKKYIYFTLWVTMETSTSN